MVAPRLHPLNQDFIPQSAPDGAVVRQADGAVSQYDPGRHFPILQAEQP